VQVFSPDVCSELNKQLNNGETQ